MPASITLSDLSWSTPDGEFLFSGLNLNFGAERTGLVGRNGVGKTTLIKLISGEIQPHSGTVAINGTIGILRQTVQVSPTETIADVLGVTKALTVLRRASSGEATSDELEAIDWNLEARVAAALGRVALDADPETRLATLSGGQRTRAALAALVIAKPDLLLLDEPTNNLDREGRKTVIDVLANWGSGAIVVSHDRALLDTMDAIVEMTSLGANRYGGNWDQFSDWKSNEIAAARRDLAVAEKRVSAIDQRAKETSQKKARKDRVGRRKGANGDMPRILVGARKNQSENTSGGNIRIAERRRAQAAETAASARERIEVVQPLTVALASTGLQAGRRVLTIDNASVGYSFERPIFRNLSLSMTGPERVSVSGPNGSGKSTLLALVTGELRPWTGTAEIFTEFALFDQRASLLDPSASILGNFKRINPKADENACRAALARFMFRADAALQVVSELSGGQLLRAGLACVLSGPTPPPLLILDEPTNHLDIDSIEAVEVGLQAYDGAMLIISHDEAFLEAVGVTRTLDLPSLRDMRMLPSPMAPA